MKFLKLFLKSLILKDAKDMFYRKRLCEFKDVTFSYHGAEEPAIRNISFSVQAR